MRTPRYIVLLCIGLFACGLAVSQTSFTTESLPACFPEQINRLDFVRANQMDVWGLERNVQIDYQNPALKWGAIPNWYPMSGFKQEFCGEVTGFGIFEGDTDPIDTDEEDFNHFIAPVVPEFQTLFDDTLPFQSDPWVTASGWPTCGKNQQTTPHLDNYKCLEAEVSPDQSFYFNPWFGRVLTSDFPFVREKSVREKKPLCVFGPWVREAAHGNKPEIHPSELLWWKDKWSLFGGNGDLYYLFGIQDDSNRFDREGDFENVFTPPMKPWNAFPKRANFNLAFLINPGLERLKYTITETDYSKNVVPKYTDERDASLTIDGRAVIAVSEIQAEPRNIGVGFAQVCRRSNGRIQGYVSLDSEFGVGDGRDFLSGSNQEGIHSIIVGVSREQFPVRPILSRAVAPWRAIADEKMTRLLHQLERVQPRRVRFVGIRPVLSTLRRINRNGRMQLSVDVEITSKPDAKLRISKIARFDGSRRLTHPFEPASKNGAIGIARHVDVTNGLRLEITTSDRQSTVLTLAGFGLHPRINLSPVEEDVSKVPWTRLLRALGIQPRTLDLQSTVHHNRSWKVGVVPGYAPVHGSRILPEDSSFLVKELNTAIDKGDRQRLIEIFGSSRMMNIEWAFTAKNLVTGANEPVSVGARDRVKGIEVTLRDNPAEGFTVTFNGGPEEAVYELLAIGTVTDELGLRAEIRLPIASHTVYAEPSESSVSTLLADLSSVQRVDSRALDRDSRIPGGIPSWAEQMNHRKRRAQLLRIFLTQSLSDRRLTLQEIRQGLALAKRYAETSVQMRTRG